MGMHQPVDSFDPQKVAESVYNMMKYYTTSTMEMIKKSMEQMENVTDTMVDQSGVIQNEFKKLMNDWMKQAKNGQRQYMDMLDENLKKMDDFLNSANSKQKKPDK
jgi:polyhydroxyalkanoate synthesis regulator phasin